MVVDQTAAGPAHPPTPVPPANDVPSTYDAGARGCTQSRDRTGHEPATPGQGEARPTGGSHTGADEASRG
eukprot:6405740-Alexandrium_andersonii.AAC.1